MTNTLHTAKTGMSMDTGYREGRGGGGGGGNSCICLCAMIWGILSLVNIIFYV